MLETVSAGFRAAKNFLKGQALLTENNVDEALKQVRRSLLEADVDFHVVRNFLDRVKQKALGETVALTTHDKSGRKLKIGPAEHFVGICQEELEALMGPVDTSIKISQPVATIMMVGLQGSGKTTTTGKLAQYLIKKNLRPMLVAADIYRPAAVDQLKVLGAKLNIPVYASPGVLPPELCQTAIQKAKEHQCNVVIFDTAGRLAVDEALMNELEQIKSLTRPDNIFLVVDSMMGQDAVKTAAGFNRRLQIDGFILTKLDGDARGGAALAIKEVTQKPIKFLGMGEHLDNLEEFRPQGLASRILGMGDVVGLIKDFEEHADHEQSEKDAMRMLQGKFTLQDFLEQLRMIKKMGSLSSLLDKLPGMGDLMPAGKSVDDGELGKMESIVLSMTKVERVKPELIEKQKTRRRRIALGSGRKEQEVDQLLKKFLMMKQMMQVMSHQPGLLGRVPGPKQMGQISHMAQASRAGALPSGFGTGMPPPMMSPGHSANTSQKSNKAKKEKRKREKAARKKNKKR